LVSPLFVEATWLASMLDARLLTVSAAGRSCASAGEAWKRSADSLSTVNNSIKPRFLLVASSTWAFARERLFSYCMSTSAAVHSRTVCTLCWYTMMMNSYASNPSAIKFDQK
jgi:hypothetical protein